jgi:hypothetical protein
MALQLSADGRRGIHREGDAPPLVVAPGGLHQAEARDLDEILEGLGAALVVAARELAGERKEPLDEGLAWTRATGAGGEGAIRAPVAGPRGGW